MPPVATPQEREKKEEPSHTPLKAAAPKRGAKAAATGQEADGKSRGKRTGARGGGADGNGKKAKKEPSAEAMAQRSAVQYRSATSSATMLFSLIANAAEWEWARNDTVTQPLRNAHSAVENYAKASDSRALLTEFLSGVDIKTLKTRFGDGDVTSAIVKLPDLLNPLLEVLEKQIRALRGMHTERCRA